MRSSTTPLIRTLASSTIARGLSDGEVETLFEMTTPGTVKCDELLFQEGALADCLVVITEGKVDVVKKGRVLATLGKGDVLGEVSVFELQQTRTASIRARTDVRYLRIAAAQFRRTLAAGDLAALKVVANLAQQMCQRLLLANEKLVESTPAPVARAVGHIGW
jgi:CRP-like cAMP-binding protein